MPWIHVVGHWVRVRCRVSHGRGHSVALLSRSVLRRVAVTLRRHHGRGLRMTLGLLTRRGNLLASRGGWRAWVCAVYRLLVARGPMGWVLRVLHYAERLI